MVNQELVDYVQKELSKGFSYDQIKAMLLQYKYPENLISETFAYVQNQNQNQKKPEAQLSEQHIHPMMDIQSASSVKNDGKADAKVNGQMGQVGNGQVGNGQVGNGQNAQKNAQNASTTQNADLSKTQKATVHYVSVLSGLVILIVLIQLFTSKFSPSNIVKFLVFLFIAVMTIVYAKIHYAKPKFTLMYRIFLGLDILICLGLMVALFYSK